MLTLACPLTYERYLSEVQVLLGVRTRPLCIAGAPRATAIELLAHLGEHDARLVGPYQLLVGPGTLITLFSDRLVLEEAPTPPAPTRLPRRAPKGASTPAGGP